MRGTATRTLYAVAWRLDWIGSISHTLGIVQIIIIHTVQIHYNYLHIRRLLVPSAAAAADFDYDAAAAADFGVMALVDGDVGFGSAASDHCLH